jgi:hypothetical protein
MIYGCDILLLMMMVDALPEVDSLRRDLYDKERDRERLEMRLVIATRTLELLEKQLTVLLPKCDAPGLSEDIGRVFSLFDMARVSKVL